MGRSPCCAKEGLNKGAWTAIEDKILTDYISIHGEGKWRHLPKRAGLKRCGKSCRLRWLNYLRPDIKRGNITHDEEDLIIRLHKLLGNRWSLIAGRLPGRTDNEIKNYWNTIIGKKIQNKNSKLSPPSSGACSPSSSTGQNLAKKARPLSIGSDVVYTKATRCTKVIVSKEIEPLMVNYNNNNSDRYEKIIETSSSLSLLPPFGNYEEEGINNNNALDFMADFEMDESFFTGLLNMDLSSEPPSYFENKVDDQVEVVNSNDETSTNIITHHRPLSHPTYSNNDNAPEFYDNSLHGSSQDFQSMSGIMKENEFDWLSTF